MKKTLYNQLRKLRNNAIPAVCILLAVLVLAVPVAAQVQQTFSDDFEDGNVDGWEGYDTYPEIRQTSVEGTYSAYSRSGGDVGLTTWNNGPILALDEEFTVEMTFRGDWTGTDKGLPIRTGLSSGSPNEVGENAFVLFDGANNVTYLGNYSTADAPSSSTNRIDNAFEDEWVNIKMQSDGEGNLQLKVWEYGTTEPSSYQISTDFDGTSGSFVYSVGASAGDQERQAWLDSVAIQGIQDTDPLLTVDSRNLIKHGDTADYTVYYTEQRVGKTNISDDVTAEANVTSLNTSVVTVDETNNQLIATSDTSVNNRVNVRAEYNGSVTFHEVTVASITADNLEILPFIWRFGALLIDKSFNMILVGLFLAIGVTRYSNGFAGISVFQMALTGGWLIGWVPIGVALVSLFTTLFIGLNMAANIDYTVRR